MIAFCIGFMVGGTFGMMLTAIVTAADWEDDEEVISDDGRSEDHVDE